MKFVTAFEEWAERTKWRSALEFYQAGKHRFGHFHAPMWIP
jgi:hypothetical protein